jgi:hypothetical protein
MLENDGIMEAKPDNAIIHSSEFMTFTTNFTLPIEVLL